MRLFPKKLVINSFDGFDNHDMFEHKKFGVGLQKIFEEVEEPMTVILDAPWGAGKTTFIEMWCGHMRQRGFPIIHFDAFEHDYVDDAFAALAGEVMASAEEYGLDDDTKQSFLDGAVEVTKKVFVAGFKGAVKTVASKAIGKEAIQEISEVVTSDDAELASKALCAAVAKGADVAIAETLEKRISSRVAERKSFKAFKDQLVEIAEALKEKAAEKAKEEGYELQDGDNSRPLIFVIDELDRCKPPFSLAVLEMIKHFFAQKGIHFLLVTHVAQLENSVKYAYGIKNQAGEYLQKFYNLVLRLPANVENEKNLKLYQTKLLADIIQLPSQYVCLGDELPELQPCFNKLSLRTLEKVVAQVKLISVTISQNYLRDYSEVVLTVAILKVVYPDFYEKVVRGEATISELAELLMVSLPPIDYNTFEFFSVLACCFGDVDTSELGNRNVGERRRAMNAICDSVSLFGSA